MNRPYTAHSPYSLTPTERIRSPLEDAPETDHVRATYDGLEEYEDYDEYDDYEPIDRRWIWIAGVAGAILLVAVICTVVILGGGDSGSISTTVASADDVTAAGRHHVGARRDDSVRHRRPPRPCRPRRSPPSRRHASAPPSAAPTEAAPPPAPAPSTVTYTVTGNRQLIDLVTVIYTDQQGALQTDVNVALPWSKTVVLDPGVSLSSVTATSVMGQLNCSISDAAGALIAQQNANSMITTCTK